jgi:uncharacterized membrane protein YhhN
MIKLTSLVVLVVASLCIFVADYMDNKKLRYFSKPLLMPALAVFYFYSSNEFVPDIYVIIALFFAFIGDIALMWPKKKTFFMIGLSSFLLCHVVYIYIFLKSVDFLSGNFILLLIFIPFALLGYLIYRKLSPYLGDMKVPVIIYMTIIMLMSFLSITRICCFSGYSLFLPILGSVFFIISDTILAFYEFKSKFPKGGVYYMSTYILAQLLIVIGLL